MYCRYFGKTRAELVGRNILDLVLDEDRQKVMNVLFLNIESGTVSDIEFRAAHVSGAVRWQRWTYRTILDGQGKAVEMEGIGRDVTEHYLHFLKTEQRKRANSPNAMPKSAPPTSCNSC